MGKVDKGIDDKYFDRDMLKICIVYGGWGGESIYYRSGCGIGVFRRFLRGINKLYKNY